MSGQRIARSEYDLARELIEDAVPQHIEAWAATIGLKQKDALFEQFREELIDTPQEEIVPPRATFMPGIHIGPQ